MGDFHVIFCISPSKSWKRRTRDGTSVAWIKLFFLNGYEDFYLVVNEGEFSTESPENVPSCHWKEGSAFWQILLIKLPWETPGSVSVFTASTTTEPNGTLQTFTTSTVLRTSFRTASVQSSSPPLKPSRLQQLQVNYLCMCRRSGHDISFCSSEYQRVNQH